MVRIPRPQYYRIPDSDEKFPSIAAAERALDRRERIRREFAKEIAIELAEKQQPLEKEFERILYDNLWELYAR